MNPIQLKFLTEKYEKENKGLKFQEKFIALPGLKPISGKFYAKHDVLSPQDAPVEYVDLVKRSVSATPKDNYNFPPPSMNMEYGWYIEPLIPRSLDKRINFTINQCDFVKTEILIKEMQKKMPEKKFEGIPFRM